MKKSLFLVLILIIQIVVAAPENYNDRTSLNMQYSSDAEINLEGSSSFTYFKAYLYLFPKESERQEVLFITTDPAADQNQEEIIFTWNSFQPTLKLDLTSDIKTTNQIYPVSPENFPIRDLEPEYEQYLEAGEIIDINPDIVNKASEIIGGETDLYTAVFKIATWVNQEVEYDLNTLTADAAQKSSWTLEHKEGVCDEITSLFISMLRSVGIPARFVSGVAYSNINYNFENHGWAEVYFPDQGWVPYDVTFTQFGWIDPGHVTLARSLDAGQATIKYTWKSRDTSISSSDFNNDVSITNTGSKIQPPFNINTKILVNNVGPGSYVPIQVTVDNSNDKYLTDTITITKAPANPEDGNQKSLLLSPSKSQSEFWLVQVSDDLTPGYTYTSEIEAKDMFGKTSGTQLTFGSAFETVTKQEAEDLISELRDKEVKSYSEEISLNCYSEKSYYYDFEEPKIICEAKNIGNVLQNNVRICLENDCVTKDLMIGVKETITFDNVPNKNKLTATLIKGDIHLEEEINLRLFNEPDLIITGFQAPDEIDYNKNFNISFVLSSEAKIKDITINIDGLKPLKVTKNNKAQTVIIDTNSKYFITEEIHLKVNFKDENDREFEIEKKAEIKINNLPWYQKILAFFKKLF